MLYSTEAPKETSSFGAAFPYIEPFRLVIASYSLEIAGLPGFSKEEMRPTLLSDGIIGHCSLLIYFAAS